MCKSQRDIEVEQQRQWRASKKERDSIKRMHSAMNIQPPRSPISPSPPETVIPSVEERMQGYADSGYFEQYGHIFYPDVGGSSYDPPPPPPDSYGPGASSAAAPFYAPPPPPLFGSSSFGSASSSMMAPLHSTQAAPHGLSAGELAAARLSDALFAPHFGMSSSISSFSNSSLDISLNSLEATTLPENAYLVSNLWLDTHDWNRQSPSGGNGSGGGKSARNHLHTF